MRHPVIVVFCIAFAIRIGYVLLIQLLHPNSIYFFDSWGYLNIGYNLFHDGIFTQMTAEPQTPDSTRTPFYPIFISALHVLQLGGEWIVIIQSFIGAFTASIATQCALLLKRNKVAAFVVGIFVAINTPSIIFSNAVMTETWFTFFLTISVYYLIKSIKFEEPNLRLYAVLFMVCAAYTRPSAVYLLVLIPLLALLFNQHGLKYELKQTAMIISIGALLVAPWYYRNYKTFGSAFFSSIAEVNYLFHTASNINAKVNGTTRRVEEYKYRNNVPLSEYSFTHNSRVIPLFQKFARQECISVIKEHPLVALKIFSKSFVGFFIKPIRAPIGKQLYGRKWNDTPPLTMVESNNSYWQSLLTAFKVGTKLEGLLICFQLLFLVVLYLSILGSIPIWFKSDLNVGIALMLLILFFSVTSSITDLDARFRVPVIPILAILAFPFWNKLLKKYAHE